MKVAFFHDAKLGEYNGKFYTSGGLTNNYLQRYLKFFAKLTLCTRKNKIQTEEETKKMSACISDNIEFNGIEKLSLSSLLWGKDRKKIQENVNNNDFCIIRLPSFIGIFACMEARKQKKNYLIEMVGCAFDALWNYGQLSKKIVAPIFAILNKYELKRAKNVTYVSNKFLQRRYPTNGNYIACSDVNIETIENDNLDRRIRKINNNDEDKNIIYKFGIIGSLNVDYKGHETAIQAMSKIKNEIDFELHFLGSGDKSRWIEMAKKYKIEDKIFFDGVLPHKEVNKWLDDIDIYLIPSLTEGMPRALIEAMSRACPAIGTKVGGIPELLEKQMLINKKDAEQLVKKIKELIKNKEKMIEQANRNFNKSLEFEKNKLERKREQFYNKMLKEIKISECK